MRVLRKFEFECLTANLAAGVQGPANEGELP